MLLREKKGLLGFMCLAVCSTLQQQPRRPQLLASGFVVPSARAGGGCRSIAARIAGERQLSWSACEIVKRNGGGGGGGSVSGLGLHRKTVDTREVHKTKITASVNVKLTYCCLRGVVGVRLTIIA